MVKARVFVTVGTDHHPFDRLVEWADAWFAQSHGAADCFIQSGTSTPPRRMPGQDYLDYEVMREWMKSATAVVCHGGPATIMECRYSGVKPIVVPRRRSLGEHVNDHQVDFSRRMAESGQVSLAATSNELMALLDCALIDPESFRLQGEQSHVREAVDRFGQMVDALFLGPVGPQL
jgi:UDP-N-acetylglucosamine transferase subunit ALG13